MDSITAVYRKSVIRKNFLALAEREILAYLIALVPVFDRKPAVVFGLVDYGVIYGLELDLAEFAVQIDENLASPEIFF